MVRPLVTWPDKGYILMTYQGGTLSIKSSLTGVRVLYKYIEYQLAAFRFLIKFVPPSMRGQGLFPSKIDVYADISRGLLSYFLLS